MSKIPNNLLISTYYQNHLSPLLVVALGGTFSTGTYIEECKAIFQQLLNDFTHRLPFNQVLIVKASPSPIEPNVITFISEETTKTQNGKRPIVLMSACIGMNSVLSILEQLNPAAKQCIRCLTTPTTDFKRSTETLLKASEEYQVPFHHFIGSDKVDRGFNQAITDFQGDSSYFNAYVYQQGPGFSLRNENGGKNFYFKVAPRVAWWPGLGMAAAFAAGKTEISDADGGFTTDNITQTDSVFTATNVQVSTNNQSTHSLGTVIGSNKIAVNATFMHHVMEAAVFSTSMTAFKDPGYALALEACQAPLQAAPPAGGGAKGKVNAASTPPTSTFVRGRQSLGKPKASKGKEKPTCPR